MGNVVQVKSTIQICSRNYVLKLGQIGIVRIWMRKLRCDVVARHHLIMYRILWLLHHCGHHPARLVSLVLRVVSVRTQLGLTIVL